MGYSKEEQETNLNFDYSTGLWTAYSTVPKHIRKLQKIAQVKVLESENDRPIAVQASLTEKQVSMKMIRVLSEEAKAKAVERGLNLAKSKK